MRVIRRVLLISLLLPAPIGLVGQVQAGVDDGTPARGGKTVKECNEELARNTAALEAAGESASSFFHACWLHSEKGKPTPIVADGKGAAQPDGHPGPKQAAEAGTGERHRAVRRATRHAVARLDRERRTVRVRRERVDDEANGVDDAAAIRPQASRYQADRLPGHVNIGVPLVGVVAVPIPPGLESTVQSVVEHPVVPGLVSTSP